MITLWNEIKSRAVHTLHIKSLLGAHSMKSLVALLVGVSFALPTAAKLNSDGIASSSSSTTNTNTNLALEIGPNDHLEFNKCINLLLKKKVPQPSSFNICLDFITGNGARAEPQQRPQSELRKALREHLKTATKKEQRLIRHAFEVLDSVEQPRVAIGNEDSGTNAGI